MVKEGVEGEERTLFCFLLRIDINNTANRKPDQLYVTDFTHNTHISRPNYPKTYHFSKDSRIRDDQLFVIDILRWRLVDLIKEFDDKNKTKLEDELGGTTSPLIIKAEKYLLLLKIGIQLKSFRGTLESRTTGIDLIDYYDESTRNQNLIRKLYSNLFTLPSTYTRFAITRFPLTIPRHLVELFAVRPGSDMITGDGMGSEVVSNSLDLGNGHIVHIESNHGVRTPLPNVDPHLYYNRVTVNRVNNRNREPVLRTQDLIPTPIANADRLESLSANADRQLSHTVDPHSSLPLQNPTGRRSFNTDFANQQMSTIPYNTGLPLTHQNNAPLLPDIATVSTHRFDHNNTDIQRNQVYINRDTRAPIFTGQPPYGNIYIQKNQRNHRQTPSNELLTRIATLERVEQEEIIRTPEVHSPSFESNENIVESPYIVKKKHLNDQSSQGSDTQKPQTEQQDQVAQGSDSSVRSQTIKHERLESYIDNDEDFDFDDDLSTSQDKYNIAELNNLTLTNDSKVYETNGYILSTNLEHVCSKLYDLDTLELLDPSLRDLELTLTQDIGFISPKKSMKVYVEVKDLKQFFGFDHIEQFYTSIPKLMNQVNYNTCIIWLLIRKEIKISKNESTEIWVVVSKSFKDLRMG